MANNDNVTTKKRNSADGSSFEFLATGWWIWHVVAIVGVFYLGHLLWPR